MRYQVDFLLPLKLQKISYYFGLCWKILLANQFAGFFTFDLFGLLILIPGVHYYIVLVLIFFKAYFFQSHCYLKLTLFRLQNYHEFSRIFLCGELHRFGGINDLDLTNFQIQAQHKIFQKEHVTYSF